MNAVSLKNAAAGYSGFSIDVNADLPAGSVSGIIGPNGSGKTTTLRTISRSLALKGGAISLHGTPLSDFDQRSLAQTIAVVSQEVSAESISVRDYVLLGRMPHMKPMQFFESAHDRTVAERYMKLTGVDCHADKYLSAMSGGERQLAAIARALTQEPSILLLDEPTSHLDITHQVKLLDLIRRLKRELSISIVMTIHDLNLASEYCDHLVLMKEGRVFASGTPAAVLTYQNIEDVYRTVVIVKENPLSKKPYVFVVPGEENTEKRKSNETH